MEGKTFEQPKRRIREKAQFNVNFESNKEYKLCWNIVKDGIVKVINNADSGIYEELVRILTFMNETESEVALTGGVDPDTIEEFIDRMLAIYGYEKDGDEK